MKNYFIVLNSIDKIEFFTSTNRPHIWIYTKRDLFVKLRKKKTLNREIRVNKALNIYQNNNYRICPSIIGFKYNQYILFEHIKYHNEIDLSSNHERIIFLNSILIFQNQLSHISLLNQLVFNFGTLKLFHSGIVLCVRRLIFSDFITMIKAIFIILHLDLTTKRERRVLVHKDITCKKNYRFDGFKMWFTDLEQGYLESKWFMYDLIIFAFDSDNLTLDMKLVEEYTDSIEDKISPNNVINQIRFSLLRYCIGASNNILNLKIFTKSILLNNINFGEWVKSQ